MNKQNIQTWISWLRIVATMAVVMLHTSSTLTGNLDIFNLTNGELVYLNSVHWLCMWSVPVFFMITGALLLRPEKMVTYETCLKKYAARITGCLFLFGTVFAAMKIVASTTNRGGKSLILNSLYSVISGDSFDHLWYLYALIGIYMILPILKAFVNSDVDGRNIRWSLLLLLTFAFVVPLIEQLTGADIAFYIPMTYTVFYLLLGHYLNCHQTLSIRVDVVIVLIVACMFAGAEIIGLGGIKIAAYYSPITAVLAAVIFDLFRHLKARGNVERLWKIDRLCFGVYLIHPVFIHLSYRFLGLTPIKFGGLYPLATFGFCIMFTLCSFIGTWLMIQIPFIKRLIN